MGAVVASGGRGSAPTRARSAAALALLATLLGACGNDPVVVELEVIEEVEFDPSLGIDLAQMTELPEGVYIQDLVEGTGTSVAPGEHLSLDYTGWLKTGVEFDSGHIADLQYLVDRFIAGFEIGLATMAVGGVRRMIIPPTLAYGTRGNGPIPPGAIVIFEVELLSVS